MASLSTTVGLAAKPCFSNCPETTKPLPSRLSCLSLYNLPHLVASRRSLLCSASKSSSSRSQRSAKDAILINQQKDSEIEGEDGDEEYVKPILPGEEPDFWEGPQWTVLGFIVQYLWAIGIVVALVGCFIAVRYYNAGASDFKETEVYKEAMESQGFVEAPSDSKIFDEGAPKDAPSLPQ